MSALRDYTAHNKPEDKFARYVVKTYLKPGYSQKGINEAFLLNSLPFDIIDYKVEIPEKNLPADFNDFLYFSFAGIYFKYKK